MVCVSFTQKLSFQVKVSVFLAYMRSVGLPIAIAIIFLYLLNNVAAIGANLWLSDWSDDIATNGTQDAAQRDMRLGVYGALGLAQGKTSFRLSLFVSVNCSTCFERLCGEKVGWLSK